MLNFILLLSHSTLAITPCIVLYYLHVPDEEAEDYWIYRIRSASQNYETVIETHIVWLHSLLFHTLQLSHTTSSVDYFV